VRVEVRHAVAEKKEVELQRLVVGLDRSTDRDQLLRERQQLVWLKIGQF
jgi:hypothetical protein